MLIEVTGTYCVSNIKYLRRKYSLSRKALAKLIGIRFSLLKMIEEGESVEIFSHWELERLCAVFDVPKEILMHQNLLE